MMKFKHTEEQSRTYKLVLKKADGREHEHTIIVKWYDEEAEWVVESTGCFNQAELEEVLRIVTALNKERK